MENEFISSTNIDIEIMWQNILEEIAKNISAIAFDVWFKTLEIVDIKENVLVVSTPTTSSKSTLLKNYKDKIITAANKIYSAINKVEIFVKEAEDDKIPQKESETKTRVYVDESTPSKTENVFHFNPKYTFENFIVGGSNQFASAAAKAVAEAPSTKINPLFIYGGSGLGKTHLLHAIGNYVIENSPELNVVYVTTDKFTNDFISALQSNTTQKFREVYSKADILIIMMM